LKGQSLKIGRIGLESGLKMEEVTAFLKPYNGQFTRSKIKQVKVGRLPTVSHQTAEPTVMRF
jgi:hypothetical protein